MITQRFSNPAKSSEGPVPDGAKEAATAPREAAMPPQQSTPTLQEPAAQAAASGNGSVAHQIIEQFLKELDSSEEEAITEISSNLRGVVFSGKPSELDIKIALFGV
jgi:hypothetical protein